jgi:hypothetical protein
VLGGTIHVPGLDYVDYVVPGIFLEAVLIGGMTTALALAEGKKSLARESPQVRSAKDLKPFRTDPGFPLPRYVDPRAVTDVPAG